MHGAIALSSCPVVPDDAVCRPLRRQLGCQVAEELSKMIRSVVLPSLPLPLVEQNYRWGQQKNVVVGMKWEREGIFLKPELQKKIATTASLKIQVEADHPETTLKVQIQDVATPEKGKLTFKTCLSLQTNIKFEQQVWKAGTRFYSGETRARAGDVEAELRIDFPVRQKTRFLDPGLCISITSNGSFARLR